MEYLAPAITLPPPEPTLPAFGFLAVPSMWTLGLKLRPVWDQALHDLGSRGLIRLYSAPPRRSLLGEFEMCDMCAGVCVVRDLMQPIPQDIAQLIDFFFGRDKHEALVYEWQPFEKFFQLKDRDWLLARRCI